jgi:hypothetical protein
MELRESKNHETGDTDGWQIKIESFKKTGDDA